MRAHLKNGLSPWRCSGGGEDARRQLFGMGVIIALKKRGAFMELLT